jgi:hypothetical protein
LALYVFYTFFVISIALIRWNILLIG